jgi:hypothetical protein
LLLALLLLLFQFSLLQQIASKFKLWSIERGPCRSPRLNSSAPGHSDSEAA